MGKSKSLLFFIFIYLTQLIEKPGVMNKSLSLNYFSMPVHFRLPKVQP
jgi:hypothetical protein